MTNLFILYKQTLLNNNKLFEHSKTTEIIVLPGVIEQMGYSSVDSSGGKPKMSSGEHIYHLPVHLSSNTHTL